MSAKPDDLVAVRSLVEYDEDGRAELHFDDPFDDPAAGDYSHTHSKWVAPEFIERHRT
jgi:hypothetical protein